MANVIPNYFVIKKHGSTRDILNAKKTSASVSLSSKGDKTKNLDNGCTPTFDKPSAQEEVGIEQIVRTKTVRKRKISHDSQEVKITNPPRKLIKLTVAATTKESVPQSNHSNGNVLDKLTQHAPKNANSRLELVKPESNKKLEQLKKRSDSNKNALAKPVLQQEKTTPLVAKAISVTSKSESSNEVTSQKYAKIPDYQQCHDLASNDVTSSLELPLKFRYLAEAFRCLDTVISLMYNRQEICPFTKIKPDVENITRRKFDLLHLGQIKTVYPTAYHFQLDKLHIIRNTSTEPQLTVSPNMDCFSVDEQLSSSVKEEKPYTGIRDKNDPSRKNDNDNLTNARKVQQFEKMRPSFLVARRNIFRSRLMKIVEQCHREFLTTLNPPIILNVGQHINRYHPKFSVNSIPDIVPSELPKPVETRRYYTAMDVLHKIKGLYGKKVDDALELVSKESAPTSNATVVSQLPPVSQPPLAKPPPQLINSSVKGIPLDLLQKIRAKEAARIKADMTRSPEAELRLQMMARLPVLARVLRNLFISEKKAVISLSDVSSKISESHVGSISQMDMEKHLYLLKELAPNWLSILNIRAGIYLKMNKTTNVNDVISKIENDHKLATLA